MHPNWEELSPSKLLPLDSTYLDINVSYYLSWTFFSAVIQHELFKMGHATVK